MTDTTPEDPTTYQTRFYRVRPAAEECEQGTVGCQIDHLRDHGPCDTTV